MTLDRLEQKALRLVAIVVLVKVMLLLQGCSNLSVDTPMAKIHWYQQSMVHTNEVTR